MGRKQQNRNNNSILFSKIAVKNQNHETISDTLCSKSPLVSPSIWSKRRIHPIITSPCICLTVGGMQNRAAGGVGHQVRGDRDSGVLHHQCSQVLHSLQETMQSCPETTV